MSEQGIKFASDSQSDWLYETVNTVDTFKVRWPLRYRFLWGSTFLLALAALAVAIL